MHEVGATKNGKADRTHVFASTKSRITSPKRQRRCRLSSHAHDSTTVQNEHTPQRHAGGRTTEAADNPDGSDNIRKRPIDTFGQPASHERPPISFSIRHLPARPKPRQAEAGAHNRHVRKRSGASVSKDEAFASRGKSREKSGYAITAPKHLSAYRPGDSSKTGRLAGNWTSIPSFVCGGEAC